MNWGSWAHMDNYGLVVIKVGNEENGYEERTILESTFNLLWKCVGYVTGTKMFVRRIYLSKLLNPKRTNCSHMECDCVETFGYESNIIRCRKCKIYFRESSNHFGVCYYNERILYRGKFDKSQNTLEDESKA